MSNQSFAERADATTAAELRSIGGTKWADPDMIGAFVAEMDFGVAPEIREALHLAVEEGAFGYAPPRITGALKAQTAERLRSRHGWNVTGEDVFAVPDVITAYEVAIQHFSAPGTKVIVPTPSYMPFLTVPGTLGREVIEVPMLEVDGIWQFDLVGLQAAFEAGGGILALCNPYNPLGRVFTREELLAVSEVVDRNGGRVFSDEIWSPLVYPGTELMPYATLTDVTAGHTITATAASKARNLPGLKCAQLVVSNAVDRTRMAELEHWAGRGTATLGMIAATVAYADGDAWLGEALDYLRGNRDELVAFVAEHLPGVRVTSPEATYVAWLDFRELGIEEPAAFFQAHAGVGLTEGSACGEAGRGCARFIFALPRPLMREALERMRAALSAR
ncbi:MalY/PatB family protein [Leucobacter komagatae]|uniref:cysteine-S-conjugate beta-lyase n=1 Tax=Leucobacter komagatae TaxID=55969 RepID=A0A0D0H6A0_9MICO|nr:aminotransferase class I/II-fold pyridoxal phosphate-dependent enzyme [Leucobacter komagatae]KIP52690.1 aminotransferase class I/II [Leucobacter komagatae]